MPNDYHEILRRFAGINGSTAAFDLAAGRHPFGSGIRFLDFGTTYAEGGCSEFALFEGGGTIGGDCACDVSNGRDRLRPLGLVRAFSLLSRSSNVTPVDGDDDNCSAVLRFLGAIIAGLVGLLSVYSGATGLRCSSTSPCGAERTCVALLPSW